METGIELGYKLCRMTRDGALTPLFINRKSEIRSGTWLPAESHPTKGYAFRPFWHCCRLPKAPHLKERLKSGEMRTWVEVLARVEKRIERPIYQGNEWWLASEIFVTKTLDPEDVDRILQMAEGEFSYPGMNLSCNESVDIQTELPTI